ncbi:MAG: PspA/IM30 family protein [Clostridia bacterium]|nr:PspA/IM30 family protein [Clostridia bacterium]
MAILERLGSILKANINDLIDRAEDPAKMVDQTLRELREDLAEVKKETANVMADEKSAKRKVDDCLAEIEKADRAAKNALQAGNEGDAQKIVTKKLQLQQNLTSFQQNYDLARANAEKMRQAHDKLVSDIESLENRKDSVKAKMAAAKTQEHINKMTSGVDTASSLEAFDRWEAKADKMFDAAEAEAKLNEGDSTDDLVDKYASGSNADVDAEMAKMKAELGL